MGKMLEDHITSLDQSAISAQALNTQLEIRAEQLALQLQMAGKWKKVPQKPELWVKHPDRTGTQWT